MSNAKNTGEQDDEPDRGPVGSLPVMFSFDQRG